MYEVCILISILNYTLNWAAYARIDLAKTGIKQRDWLAKRLTFSLPITCRIFLFASSRANKFAYWKTGLKWSRYIGARAL